MLGIGGLCSGEVHVGYDMRQADCFRWMHMRLEVSPDLFLRRPRQHAFQRVVRMEKGCIDGYVFTGIGKCKKYTYKSRWSCIHFCC
jgi:hypothetical protein